MIYFAPLASAGHYKYSALSWHEVFEAGTEPNTVRFTLLSSWSTDYAPYKSQGTGGVVTVNDVIRIQGLGNPVLEFGDGTSQLLKAKVISVNPVLQSWLGVSTVDHAYPSRSAFLAVFSGCCRGTYLANNAGEYWNVTSAVNLNRQTISDWEGWAFSPRADFLSRVTVRANRNITISIPATTPGLASVLKLAGRPLRWALGAAADYGAAGAAPLEALPAVSASIDAATGLLTVSAPPGVYSVCVVVRDLSQGGASAAVDFELEALGAAAAAAAPAWDLQYPAAPAPAPARRTVYIGYQDRFVLRFNESGPAPALPDGAVVPPGAATGRPAVLSGPLPPGMAVGPLAVGTYPPGGVRGFQAEVSWTPTAAQRNETAACFSALGNNSAPALGSAAAAPPLCVALNVEADPPPQWVGNGSCADGPAATACFPNATFLIHPPPTMGKRVTVVLTARDPNVYENLTISGTSLPNTRNVELSAQARVDESGYRVVTRTLTWVPSPQEGGQTGSLCFGAEGLQTDQLGNPTPGNRAPALCVQYAVHKCVYRVGTKEALVDIARKFQMSWLQLWSLNKGIRRPEGFGIPGAIAEDDVIHVGQIVKARRGDTLDRIAARFGITLRQLLGMNRDITATVGLLLDQPVCVVPNSCSERG